MASSQLPPITENAVFSASASMVIDAPIEKVWSIILDFPSYTEWNPFVRKQTVTDYFKNPAADQTAAEGRYIYLSPVHLNARMGEPPGLFQTSSVFCQITTLDNENYRVAWNTVGVPKFILSTERWQALTIDEATGKTKYETIEAFNGFAAYFVKWFVGGTLMRGFSASAEALKKHAEKK